MNIRKATPADGHAISAIAESVRFDSRTANPRNGYLVFVGTPEEYAERSGFVAEVDGHVEAFLLTSLSSADNSVLIDQIGSRAKGAAAMLLEAAIATLAPARMTASIMHWPLRNERSIGFFEGKNHFRCIGEYEQGHGFLWGVYEWKADGTQGDTRYPLGKYVYAGPANEIDAEARAERIRRLPEALREACANIAEDALDEPLRPGAWTARQIVHHIADAHQQMAGRVRLILTEEHPRVKTFEENDWAELADARMAPIEESLLIIDGLHARLARLLDSRPHADLARLMEHPAQGSVLLDRVLSYLDWHGRHHAAQIHDIHRNLRSCPGVLDSES